MPWPQLLLARGVRMCRSAASDQYLVTEAIAVASGATPTLCGEGGQGRRPRPGSVKRDLGGRRLGDRAAGAEYPLRIGR